MQAFTQLYQRLDETTKTNDKVKALVEYLKSAPPQDAAWAVYFLIGRKPRQLIQMPKLIGWAVEAAGIPNWLFAECYHAVGDLAETVAMLLPEPGAGTDLCLSVWIEDRLLPLKTLTEEEQKQRMLQHWQEMDESQRYIYNKLLTGAFRIGVSQNLVVRAIAIYANLSPAVVSHRLMGNWQPSAEFFKALIAADTADVDYSRPYPFFLAYPLQDSPESLGALADWQAEWKWDGIRAQLIRRNGQIFLWSRGEELVTERFPEIIATAAKLRDGTVIDGEILCWRDDKVQPFALLQQRIGRKSISKTLMESAPVILMAYDLLELDYVDLRGLPLAQRRAKLSQLVADKKIAGERLLISPTIESADWHKLEEARENARNLNVEGIMLKRLSSPYGFGRQRGDWWKWKVDPHTVDAVLVYAQPGSGKRASLYTDYTFAVWANDALVPFAKAYSGLSDEEIREVDQFIRKNTVEKFGPVRTVKPELVFELAFEGIQLSNRHKSGVAVRFPRIARWRKDKPAIEADSLQDIKSLLSHQLRA